MTQVPNEPPRHPVFARCIRDLGTEFLIAHRIARLYTLPGMAGAPRVFLTGLAAIRDMPSLLATLRLNSSLDAKLLGAEAKQVVEQLNEALSSDVAKGEAPEAAFERWVQGMGALLLRHEGDRRFDPKILLEQQLSMGGNGLRTDMALARFGLERVLGREPEVQLPAPVLPRDEVPSRGEGRVEVIELGDLVYGWWAGGEKPLMDALGDARSAVRFRWVHGITGYRAGSVFAAGFAEALREAVPERFWEVIEKIYRWQNDVGARVTREVVRDLPVDPDAVLARASAPDIMEKVQRDQAMVTTCAIPPIRPAFVVGRKLFLGREKYPELAAEVRRLASVF